MVIVIGYLIIYTSLVCWLWCRLMVFTHSQKRLDSQAHVWANAVAANELGCSIDAQGNLHPLSGPDTADSLLSQITVVGCRSKGSVGDFVGGSLAWNDSRYMADGSVDVDRCPYCGKWIATCTCEED